MWSLPSVDSLREIDKLLMFPFCQMLQIPPLFITKVLMSLPEDRITFPLTHPPWWMMGDIFRMGTLTLVYHYLSESDSSKQKWVSCRKKKERLRIESERWGASVELFWARLGISYTYAHAPSACFCSDWWEWWGRALIGFSGQNSFFFFH